MTQIDNDDPSAAPVAEEPLAEPTPEPNIDEMKGVPEEGELRDEPAPAEAVSAAPPRPHASLVDQFDLRWQEFKEFVSRLEGEIDGELGEVLALARKHLGV